MIVGCSRCEALHEVTSVPPRCPACGADGPSEAADAPGGAVGPAERVLPRRVDPSDLRRLFAAWVRPVWFRGPDLDPERLAARAVAVWWPYWLVDVDADGVWQVEAGYDYPVESSQEIYAGGRWTTRKVTETRTRWEPRLGRVRRRYDNVAVPALGLLEGGPPYEVAASAAAGEAPDGPVRLPDRPRPESWPAALAQLREEVGRDCARATGADHVRELFLDVDAAQAEWTRLLVPAFTSWYEDDDGSRRVVWVHGATGSVQGPRLASPAAGRRWAWILAGSGGTIAAAGLVVGLVGLVIWPLLPLAGLLLFAGACVGLLALWPWFAPARWNRTQG